ncbi:MAG: hypothetical protein M3Q32_13795, partial [Pseudomonadota bacterium]|nr:hypothetical protein [Pseudomonadota bacterium]
WKFRILCSLNAKASAAMLRCPVVLEARAQATIQSHRTLMPASPGSAMSQAQHGFSNWQL